MSEHRALIRRGHIVLINLDPAVGSEAAKTRPAVVVSNNTANRAASLNDRGVITVVPLTSNVRVVHEFQALLVASQTGLPRDCKAQAEQVRSVAVTRVSAVAGWVDGELLGNVDEALRVHLSL
ncbi:type II toxin-antitoxin system PemK/MazF family toxin [Microbacterium sp. LRZ72]|uniref:type II toxin-antitoxin system PemK/MazF family toxin n=1 Tax=Microbacterium sp. LRZ72 TaxID=2942481 RepID=UPI0029A66EAE|nr:type II toxin-antitoxin system PemK/MazF family toxin [Microbacterium sp. LRZ72]MDX2377218.1 type II toxin-antitoxin system PemK/MazF family toxin [Microbacterium sp. LRZ72]